MNAVAKVWVPSPMRDVTGGQHTLDIPGRTVREVLTNLTSRYPGARERLLRPDGTLMPHLVLMVDGAEVRDWDTALEPDSELVITAALGGGRGSSSSKVPGAHGGPAETATLSRPH